jgi:hypothetical protein
VREMQAWKLHHKHAMYKECTHLEVKEDDEMEKKVACRVHNRVQVALVVSR